MLSQEEIKKFERALQGPAPDWDPNWQATEQLLKLVTVQAKQMIQLQAQLDVLADSNTASTEALVSSLNRDMSVGQVRNNQLSAIEVEAAVSNLNRAIESAAKGEQAMKYAGNVLGFVAKLII